MRLPGFGSGSPLMPSLGGLTGSKPAFFEKIGDPGDLTGKIFRKTGIVQPKAKAVEAAPLLPGPAQKLDEKQRGALLVNKR